MCKTFIFLFNNMYIDLKDNKLYSIDYQKGELYQEYNGIYYNDG